jgi:hypothetical protein
MASVTLSFCVIRWGYHYVLEWIAWSYVRIYRCTYNANTRLESPAYYGDFPIVNMVTCSLETCLGFPFIESSRRRQVVYSTRVCEVEPQIARWPVLPIDINANHQIPPTGCIEAAP